MRISTILLLVCLSVTSVAFDPRPIPARPRNPTPTAISTMKPAHTPESTPAPTPPAQQVSSFFGEIWLDAFGGYPRAGWVTARIGGTVCGEEVSCYADKPVPCIRIPVNPCCPDQLSYRLDVFSASVRPGCGYEGATISFFVGDERADQTAVWHAGSSQELNLTAGPRPALFRGSLTLGVEHPIKPFGYLVVPYVGGNPCGPPRYIGLETPAQRYHYSSIVHSAKQQAGCGVEGAEIVFKLLWTKMPEDLNASEVIAVARERGIWRPWDGEPSELNLTMVPIGISVGNVGTGRPTEAASSNWARASSIALLVFGAAATTTGLAMRKVACTTR